MHLPKRAGAYLAALLTSIGISAPTLSADRPLLVIMGDSISEGVQSGDAGWTTQVLTYGNWVTQLMGGAQSVPFLEHSILGIVGNPSGRSRFDPNVSFHNVAVSGADLGDVLRDRANATSTSQIDDELDLIMYPRLQTQLEYVESSAPEFVICWIGNNDALSAATSFGDLDASQLTPIADFDRDFTELATRLGQVAANNGTKILFGNIPDVTDIGFLVDSSAAEALLGFPVSLAEGNFTSLVTLLLMAVTGNDDPVGSPGFVLDPAEVILIQDRIAAFNAIIDREAARINMPVLDVNSIFGDMVSNPPVFLGVPLRTDLLGGIFSLDGIHPSNIAHALIANEVISSMNQNFGTQIPTLSQQVLEIIFVSDPEIDKDGDGVATGRFGAGLLETIALLAGFTGDSNDAP